MEKYEVNENEILEELSEVTAAKRLASMVRIFFISYLYTNDKLMIFL